MPDFTVKNEFATDEDTFWEKCFFDEEYNRRLYAEMLKFPGWKILEQKTEGNKIYRKVNIDPPVTGMPGPVKKALGDKFSYVEDGTYDRTTHRYTFKITPSTMADKTKTAGELWTEKLGDKKIVRYAKVHVEVKVFMIGGMVEDKLLGDLKSSYEQASAFTQKYLAEKGY
jgi:Protein of unknown function (DUF2505)